MFAVANTALDLLVLELVLHRLRVGVLALVLGILAPVDAGSEDDILADGCGIGCRASAVLLAEAELGPGLSVGDAGVDRLLVRNIANSTGRLYFLALVIVSECDDGLGSVLVGDGLGGREIGGLFDIVVVGPVMPILRVGLAMRNQAGDASLQGCSLGLRGCRRSHGCDFRIFNMPPLRRNRGSGRLCV